MQSGLVHLHSHAITFNHSCSLKITFNHLYLHSFWFYFIPCFSLLEFSSEVKTSHVMLAYLRPMLCCHTNSIPHQIFHLLELMGLFSPSVMKIKSQFVSLCVLCATSNWPSITCYQMQVCTIKYYKLQLQNFSACFSQFITFWNLLRMCFCLLWKLVLNIFNVCTTITTHVKNQLMYTWSVL